MAARTGRQKKGKKAKYRVGVIASGRIAREHARGWQECEHTEIVAIGDSHPEALKVFGDDFDISNRYLDYREMLDKENLDIVSVCSWDPMHAEMTIAAAARRPRAILCEKPMAVSLGEGEAMIIACQRNNVKLAIGHQRRFYSAWEEARRMVQEGEIGRPIRLWSATRAGMMNTGTHCIDFQQWVLGNARAKWVMGAVERQSDHYTFGHRVEDRCVGIIGYDDDCEGVIENEMNARYEVGATIYGADGIIEVNDNNLRYMSATSGGWQTFAPREAERQGYGRAHVDQAYGIVDWIEGKVEDYRGQAQYGFAALEVMMAVYESARCHERVHLPLQTRANPLDVAVETGVIPVTRPGRWDERAFLVRGEGMSWVK
ncbi:MAG: Gfo/Idh/MocA family oxidoreductase [Caldilineaceae bacterium]|nr:Gfo/Idh/MocA family oxidoreductase [Caldilineaceae bacterium]